MPIYIYQCDSCGVQFERLQRFVDEPLSECPACGGHVRRVIQPVGVIFRGSGFYVTDNRQVSSPTLKPSKDSGSAPAEDAGDGDGPKKEPAAADKVADETPAKPPVAPEKSPSSGGPD